MEKNKNIWATVFGLFMLVCVFSFSISSANASVCFLPDTDVCDDGKADPHKGNWWPGQDDGSGNETDDCNSSFNRSTPIDGQVCIRCTDASSRYYGKYKCSAEPDNCADYTSTSSRNICGEACVQCKIASDSNYGKYKCPPENCGTDCESLGYTYVGETAEYLSLKELKRGTGTCPYYDCGACPHNNGTENRYGCFEKAETCGTEYNTTTYNSLSETEKSDHCTAVCDDCASERYGYGQCTCVGYNQKVSECPRGSVGKDVCSEDGSWAKGCCNECKESDGYTYTYDKSNEEGWSCTKCENPCSGSYKWKCIYNEPEPPVPGECPNGYSKFVTSDFCDDRCLNYDSKNGCGKCTTEKDKCSTPNEEVCEVYGSDDDESYPYAYWMTPKADEPLVMAEGGYLVNPITQDVVSDRDTLMVMSIQSTSYGKCMEYRANDICPSGTKAVYINHWLFDYQTKKLIGRGYGDGSKINIYRMKEVNVCTMNLAFNSTVELEEVEWTIKEFNNIPQPCSNGYKPTYYVDMPLTGMTCLICKDDDYDYGNHDGLIYKHSKGEMECGTHNYSILQNFQSCPDNTGEVGKVKYMDFHSYLLSDKCRNDLRLGAACDYLWNPYENGSTICQPNPGYFADGNSASAVGRYSSEYVEENGGGENPNRLCYVNFPGADWNTNQFEKRNGFVSLLKQTSENSDEYMCNYQVHCESPFATHVKWNVLGKTYYMPLYGNGYYDSFTADSSDARYCIPAGKTATSDATIYNHAECYRCAFPEEHSYCDAGGDVVYDHKHNMLFNISNNRVEDPRKWFNTGFSNICGTGSVLKATEGLNEQQETCYECKPLSSITCTNGGEYILNNGFFYKVGSTDENPTAYGSIGSFEDGNLFEASGFYPRGTSNIGTDCYAKNTSKGSVYTCEIGEKNIFGFSAGTYYGSGYDKELLCDFCLYAGGLCKQNDSAPTNFKPMSEIEDIYGYPYYTADFRGNAYCFKSKERCDAYYSDQYRALTPQIATKCSPMRIPDLPLKYCSKVNMSE